MTSITAAISCTLDTGEKPVKENYGPNNIPRDMNAEQFKHQTRVTADERR